jgi:succinyl-CoA synthetase beta subunit
MRDEKAEHESAVQARAAGVSYAALSGRIGCIVSGAGLGMATMDLLAESGVPASSFLDLGSNITRDKIAAALRIVQPEAQAILFNIFTDKAHCDEIAEELLAALAEVQPRLPLVIRLAGRNEDQGNEILAGASDYTSAPMLVTTRTTHEAVERVALAVKGRTANGSAG